VTAMVPYGGNPFRVLGVGSNFLWQGPPRGAQIVSRPNLHVAIWRS